MTVAAEQVTDEALDEFRSTISNPSSRGAHLNAKIMMIDDEPLMIDVVQGLLEEVGYTSFVTLSEPERAMALIREHKPDVVLLDLKMPKVTGFDILNAVRRDEALRFLPIIVLTSSTDASNKLRALEYGATDFLGKPVDPSELVLRLRNTLSAKAYQDRLAYTDEQTGLPNRRIFTDTLEESLALAQVQKGALAVLQIGVDQLKQINKTLGARIGDMLIQQVAQRLPSAASVDLGDTLHETRAMVTSTARVGGNEFAVLLTGLRQLGEAASYARRIYNRLSGTYIVDGQELYVNARVGIAGYPDDGLDASLIMESASTALMQVKGSEGQHYSFYSRDANERALSRLQQENQLRKAIPNNELQLYYQPKIDVVSGKISGAEALLRWNNPLLGRVSPVDFIPVAEETGLIVPIGKWVFATAVEHLMQWRKLGIDNLPISVNVSAGQFVFGDFIGEVTSVIEQSGIATERITLEITESMLVEGGEKAIETMSQLRSLGFKLSIDDFGTGYSSLSYLKSYPVDELKIDRSFISNVDADPQEAAIVEAIVKLAGSLKLKVVVEGIETAGQLAVVQTTDCDQYQGFLYSKPIPADDFISLLQSQQ